MVSTIILNTIYFLDFTNYQMYIIKKIFMNYKMKNNNTLDYSNPYFSLIFILLYKYVEISKLFL